MKSFGQKFKEFFHQRSFKNDKYGELSNQVSHIAIGLGVLAVINSFNHLLNYSLLWLHETFSINIYQFQFNFNYIATAFAFAWLWWEIRHLLGSKDWKDFYKDLFYEWSGLLVFLFPIYYAPIIGGVVIYRLVEHINKK